jgi:hypothetical protein
MATEEGVFVDEDGREFYLDEEGRDERGRYRGNDTGQMEWWDEHGVWRNGRMRSEYSPIT